MIFIFFFHFSQLSPCVTSMGCVISIIHLTHDQDMITTSYRIRYKIYRYECAVAVMSLSL